MLLYSIIESPTFPIFNLLYQTLNIEEIQFKNIRKAMNHLKNRAPDFIVAEFFYGYSNNYAGINISNLDILLFALQKYAPKSKVIVLVDKKEVGYVAPLNNIFQLHQVLIKPIDIKKMEQVLEGVNLKNRG